jgi:hypothetical protein
MKRIFGYAKCIFQKYLRLRATLDIVGFCVFWHHQKTGFEASERNKDASHARAHSPQIGPDALHTIRVAAFLARASPNRFLKTKRGGEERGEREK